MRGIMQWLRKKTPDMSVGTKYQDSNGRDTRKYGWIIYVDKEGVEQRFGSPMNPIPPNATPYQKMAIEREIVFQASAHMDALAEAGCVVLDAFTGDVDGRKV